MSTAIQRRFLSRARTVSYLAMSVAALALSLGVLVPQTLVRASIVFPVAILLPGYALLLLAFGSDRRIDWLPALSMSALLSMAFYPLAGLLLAALSIAPSTLSAAGAVDVLVASVLTIRLLHDGLRSRLVHHPSWLPGEPPKSSTAKIGLSPLRVFILTSLTLILAAIALGVAVHLEPKAVATPFSQFYLTGSWSHVTAPVSTRPGGPLNVSLGITNNTHNTQTYRIEARIDGKTSWPAETVRLPDRAEWAGLLGGEMPREAGLHELIITLQRGDRPVGTLTLWLENVGSVGSKSSP